MEQKKETRAQIERRLKNALVFVPRDKEYSSVYFSDKGLRLEVTSESCVISTAFHTHVFNAYTTSGISRPYLYTKRLIDIANENNCATKDGYSFSALIDVLKNKEDKSEYNLVVYIDWWIFNCFQPLYSIGESEAESFLVYESYLHNIARSSVILSEKTEDITNKQFVEAVIKNMNDFIEGVDERVIFHKKTDEELVKENIEAIQEQEQEQAMEAQINGSQD